MFPNPCKKCKGWLSMCEEHRRRVAPTLLAQIESCTTEEEAAAMVEAAINDPVTGYEARKQRGEFDD